MSPQVVLGAAVLVFGLVMLGWTIRSRAGSVLATMGVVLSLQGASLLALGMMSPGIARSRVVIGLFASTIIAVVAGLCSKLGRNTSPPPRRN